MIEDEIKRVRREYGEVECGGWLFALRRPRADSTHITIVAATDGGNSRVSRTSLEFGSDPYEIRERFPQEWHDYSWVGDWHRHPSGGTVPSDQDCRGWARALDTLGIARYAGLIVGPGEFGSWAFGGVTQAWSARREGAPSLPVVEPARLERL
jgi:hypothetical protein